MALSSKSNSSAGLTSVRVGGRTSSRRAASSSLGRRLGFALWMAAALLLAAALPGAVAKVVTGQVTLNNGTQWAYLTKFSYSLGSGNFTLDVKPAVCACVRGGVYSISWIG